MEINYSYEISVHEINSPEDMSSISLLINIEGVEILAIMGKVEGNGCENDFSRNLAMRACREALKSTVNEPVIVMSGGTEGVLCPHITIYYRRKCASTTETQCEGLLVGIARTPIVETVNLGRMPQVLAVAQATKIAIEDAGIDNINNIHFVQVKCPMLSDSDIKRAIDAGINPVTFNSYESMSYSRSASALGIAIATQDILPAHLDNEVINRDWSIYSDIGSVSAGAELKNCEVIVLGNGAKGRFSPYSISHCVLKSPIDIGSINEMMKNNGIFSEKVRQVLAKADPVHAINGSRTTMFSDSDIQSTRHARAAMGGLLGGIFGRTTIYVSGGAEHQGPAGGGPLAIIYDNSYTASNETDAGRPK